MNPRLDPREEELWQVRMPKYTAGIVVRQGIIRKAPPILAWTVGCYLRPIKRWVLQRGGEMEKVGADD